MDQRVYRDILADELQYSVDLMGISDRYVFQQDLDPKHTAPIPQEFLVNNGIDLLPWSAQSPDANPIENLWDLLDRMVPITARTSKAMF
jgi:hypothetical protein